MNYKILVFLCIICASILVDYTEAKQKQDIQFKGKNHARRRNNRHRTRKPRDNNHNGSDESDESDESNEFVITQTSSKAPFLDIPKEQIQGENKPSELLLNPSSNANDFDKKIDEPLLEPIQSIGIENKNDDYSNEDKSEKDVFPKKDNDGESSAPKALVPSNNVDERYDEPRFNTEVTTENTYSPIRSNNNWEDSDRFVTASEKYDEVQYETVSPFSKVNAANAHEVTSDYTLHTAATVKDPWFSKTTESSENEDEELQSTSKSYLNFNDVTASENYDDVRFESASPLSELSTETASEAIVDDTFYTAATIKAPALFRNNHLTTSTESSENTNDENKVNNGLTNQIWPEDYWSVDTNVDSKVQSTPKALTTIDNRIHFPGENFATENNVDVNFETASPFTVTSPEPSATAKIDEPTVTAKIVELDGSQSPNLQGPPLIAGTASNIPNINPPQQPSQSVNLQVQPVVTSNSSLNIPLDVNRTNVGGSIPVIIKPVIVLQPVPVPAVPFGLPCGIAQSPCNQSAVPQVLATQGQLAGIPSLQTPCSAERGILLSALTPCPLNQRQ